MPSDWLLQIIRHASDATGNRYTVISVDLLRNALIAHHMELVDIIVLAEVFNNIFTRRPAFFPRQLTRERYRLLDH